MAETTRDMREWMRAIERRTMAAQRAVTSIPGAVGEVIRGEIIAEAERTPAAPVELTHQTALYTDSYDGRRFARIMVDFPDVVKATDGADIDIANYELWGRDDSTNLLAASTDAVAGLAAPGLTFPGLASTPANKAIATAAAGKWKHLASSTESSLRNEDMIPGTVWSFRVRAIGRTARVPGLWSEEFQVQLDLDTVAPPQPTAPALTVSHGTITVKWDGMAVTGAMPSDFSYLIVAAGDSTSPTTEIDRFHRGGGLTVISGIPYYKTQFVRFQAVDQSGLRSPWSEQATAFTTPLVDEDIILSEIDATKTMITNIGAEAILSGAILAEKLADNAVTLEKLADQAISLAKLDVVVNDKISKGITDAAAAQSLANTAQTTANGKNTNYYGATAPTGGTYKDGDNWYRTPDYKLHRWDATLPTPAWAAIADTAIATAQAAAAAAATAASTADGKAVAAQTKADQATTDAAGALSAAQTASAAASVADGKAAAAQTKADQATTDAAGALSAAQAASAAASTADGKAVAAQTKANKAEADAAAAKTVGDNAGAAAATADGKAAAAQTAANNAASAASAASTAAATAQTKADQGVTDAASAADAASNAASAATTADGKAVAAQTAANNANTAASTADGKAVAAQTAANNAASAASTADGKAVAAQTTANNASAAASTADGKAVAAQTKADTAFTNAATAQTAANTAQTAANTADGKAVTAQSKADSAFTNAATAQTAANSAATLANSIVTTSTADATGTPPSVGALWNKTNADGSLIIKTWTANTAGTAWVLRKLDDAVIGNLNAATINAGILNAARMNASDIRSLFITAGKVTAGDIVAGTLTSASGVFGTIDASVINAGTINAARLLAGDIRTKFLTAGLINASEIVAGTLTSASGVFGTIDASIINAGTINAARLNATDIRSKFITAGLITAAEITAGTLTSASGVFGTIDASVINAGTLNAARLNATDIRSKFITAGLITAAEITAGTLTSASGVFGTVDASVINAGTLNAARIAAGSIAANKLVIGTATNGMPDPGFMVPAITAARTARSSGGTPGWTVAAPPASGITSVSHLTTTTNDSFQYAPAAPVTGTAGQGIQVTAGQKWQLSVSVETDISAGVRWNVYKYNADGTVTYAGLSPYSTAAGKRALTYTYVIPAGIVAVEFALACNTTGVNWTVYGDAVVAMQTPVTLIEDGAIVTSKIAVDAVTANNIKAGEITAGKLVAGTLTSASGVFGTIDASIINAGTINAARLLAGDIRTLFLTAGKVTAADIVTGTLTSASGVFGTIDASIINAGTINAARMNATDIRSLFITAGKITAADIVTGTLTSASGVFGTIDASIINAGTINAARMNATDIRTLFLTAGKVTANDIVAGTLTSASGVFGTIDASIINAGTINAARLLAGDIRTKFLAAGLVTAADMVTGTITAASGVIGSLDIGKVTTGELNGSFITAKTLTTDKLLVSQGANLFTDPLVQDATGWSSYFTATGGKNGGGCLTIPQNSIQDGTYYAQATNLAPRRTRVVPGGTYRVGGWVYTSAAAPIGTVQLYLRHYSEGGSSNLIAANVPGQEPFNKVATVANTWTFISGMVTIPESTTYTTGVLGVFKQAGYTTGTTLWSDLSIQQAMAGELIVDGSVVASKVAANAITAKNIIVGDFANLAIGSDFEDATSVPWALAATHTISTTQKKYGTSSLRLAATTGNPSSKFTGDFRAKEAEQWYVKFWAYIDATFNGAGNSRLNLRNLANDGSLFDLRFDGITRSAWTLVEGTFTVPAGVTELTMKLWSDNTVGIAYIDDIQIRRVSEPSLISSLGVEKLTASAAAIGTAVVDKLWAEVVRAKKITTDMLVVAGENMMPNGFGETGDNTNWSAWTFDAADKPNGTFGSFTLNTQTTQYLANGQPAPAVEEDTSYILEGWIKASVTGSKVYIEAMETGGGNPVPLYILNSYAVPTAWTRFSVPVKTVAGNTNMSFRMFANHSSGTVFNAVQKIAGLSYRKQNAAALIVNGGIAATHLGVDSVTAASIKALEITAGKIAVNAITTDKINAGAITATKLEADLVLTTRIVAGPSGGTHAEMSPSGFRVFAADPLGGAPNEVIRLGVAATDDYFAITRANATLAASITKDGVGSFAQLEAKDALYYKGMELGKLIKDKTSLIAAAQRTTNGATNAYIGGPFMPYLRLEVTLEPYRMYKVWTSAVRFNLDPNVGVTLALGYQLNIISDVNNTNIFTQTNLEPQAWGGQRALVLQELFAFSGTAPAVISFLLMYGVQESNGGNGQVALRASFTQPVRLVVEDMGPTQNSVNNGAWLDGSVAAPPPKNTYMKWYDCNNSMNYQGSNAQYVYNTTQMYQGLSPAGYGNLKSIGLFPDMTADLAGATINSVRLYLNFNFWYNNAGGTARIGIHGHTGIPSTYTSVGPVVVTSGGWPKPGARWVDIPSTYWDGFKSGAWRGVYLEGDNSYETYGYADRPTIEIGYTK